MGRFIAAPKEHGGLHPSRITPSHSDKPIPGPREIIALTLVDCMEIAKANNPSLASGNWDIQTAAAQRNVVAAEKWPQLINNNSYREYVQPQRLQAARINAEPGMFSSSILALDIVLRMPIFTGGRITNDIRAADLLTLAVQNRLARTWEELMFNVSSSFFTILVQKQLVQSLEFSRDVLAKHKRRVLDMMAADKAARVDVLRTEVRMADIDQRLVRENTIMEIQRRILRTLLGINGDARITTKGDLQIQTEPPTFESAIAMAYAERGDYRAARASLDSQMMKVNAARGLKWPRVSLEGSYGMRAAAGIDDNGVAYTKRLNESSKPLRGPWSNPDSNLPVGSIGVTVDYPILDGGRINSQIREQESKLESAQALLRKLELQIRLDVETALLNVSSARRRAQATQKAIEQSKETFRIEQQKYDLGKGSITDVLDSQAAMLEAETTYFRAMAEYNIAIAQLGLATGEKR